MPTFGLPGRWAWLGLPLALFLLGLWGGMAPGREAAHAGVVIEAGCQPAAPGAAALVAFGLALAERRVDDRGFAVERWEAPSVPGAAAGWALVLLLRNAGGAERRCLVFHRLPAAGSDS